jgi:hypothetical protein
MERAKAPLAVLKAPEVGLLRASKPKALSPRVGLEGLGRAPLPKAVLPPCAAVGTALESVIANIIVSQIQNSIIDLFIVSYTFLPFPWPPMNTGIWHKVP